MTHMAAAEDCDGGGGDGGGCSGRVGGWVGRKKKNHFVVLRLLLCRVLSGYKTFTAHQLPGTQSRKITKPRANVPFHTAAPKKKKEKRKILPEIISQSCDDGPLSHHNFG